MKIIFLTGSLEKGVLVLEITPVCLQANAKD